MEGRLCSHLTFTPLVPTVQSPNSSLHLWFPMFSRMFCVSTFPEIFSHKYLYFNYLPSRLWYLSVTIPVLCFVLHNSCSLFPFYVLCAFCCMSAFPRGPITLWARIFHSSQRRAELNVAGEEWGTERSTKTHSRREKWPLGQGSARDLHYPETRGVLFL